MICFISLDYDITAASAMGRKGFLGAYRQVGSCHMLNPIICHSAPCYLHKTFFAVNGPEEAHQHEARWISQVTKTDSIHTGVPEELCVKLQTCRSGHVNYHYGLTICQFTGTAVMQLPSKGNARRSWELRVGE